MSGITMANASEHVGNSLGTSGWIVMDQSMIQAFADCTGDQQWIHTDVTRAAKESPFGATIAHGLLTLSLIPGWINEIGTAPSDAAAILNYGFDKVRFLTPVISGRRVRGSAKLLEATPKSAGRLLLKQELTVDIEGENKPALIAEFLMMAVPATSR